MHGSFSYPVATVQGNIAGCTHATVLLKVLLYSTILRLASAYSSWGVSIRVYVDDMSLQWCGEQVGSVEALMEATQEIKEQLSLLSLVVQPHKSCYVASRAVVAKAMLRPMTRTGPTQEAMGQKLGA